VKSVAIALLLLAVCAGAGLWVARELQPAEEIQRAPAAAAEPEDWSYERRVVDVPDAALATPAGTIPPGTLAEAGSTAPAKWAQVNGYAIAALERGELERAVELFEQCATAVPDQPRFRQNLAEALTRLAIHDHAERHPCPECLENLERAVKLAPDREELAQLLAMWTKEAQVEEGFWQESSLHFELSYDGKRDQLLWGSTRILNELEKAYTDLGELFGLYPVEEGRPLIRVVLYQREGFSSLTGLGDWAGGAFDGTVRVPVGDLKVEEQRLKRVLRHELVHAFVREVGGTGVPGWLNEGLAQWLEGGREQQVKAAREAWKEKQLFPLEKLQGSLASWDDPAQITLAYQQSLLICDFLARQYGERVLFGIVDKDPAAKFEGLTRVPLADAIADLERQL
jgi:tetratricopeptide (TPR) repeat protein